MTSSSNYEGGQRSPRRYDRERDSVYDWQRDWRDGVNESIKALTDQQHETALVMERILGRLADLEKRPSEARALFGVANQGLGSLLGVGALLVAIVSTLLQHVTFH